MHKKNLTLEYYKRVAGATTLGEGITIKFKSCKTANPKENIFAEVDCKNRIIYLNDSEDLKDLFWEPWDRRDIFLKSLVVLAAYPKNSDSNVIILRPSDSKDYLSKEINFLKEK